MNENSGKPLNGELELINKYARSKLEENDVYVFSVVLCDNEIDRDFERFSDDALETLKDLFVGVTGISDHNPKTQNQNARIFACVTEKSENKLCSDGKIYRRLCARAYIPKSDGNREFILSLDSGIKKEVSVGCAVKKRICSVCGEDISRCGHIKGQKYGEKLCYAELREPVDAYEWSFVAVPAQKAAGVIKSCQYGGGSMDVEKKLLGGEELNLTADEVKELAEKFKNLKSDALQGKYYRSRVINDVMALSAAAMPELSEETIKCITANMNIEQLDELKKAFEKKASRVFPIKPQLFKDRENFKNGNSTYKNI